MSTITPLLQTIEPDDPSTAQASSRNTTPNARPAVVLTPTNNMASVPADAESGLHVHYILFHVFNNDSQALLVY
jgi:hypothetical protein